ncbi:selenide, water dikinase SelD, partial [Caldithrix abyssi]
MQPIYLDYNATAPIDPLVAEAMKPYLNAHFGNPSSAHYYGFQTRQAVEQARRQVARMLGCAPDEIIFTSGGSESNNYAIKGATLANRQRGNHIITSQIEHPAVLEVCRYLESLGFRVTYLPVDEYGMVNPQAVQKAITDRTILITIMHANNEVGTIQPIAEISRLAHAHGIIMHTDAAQSIGKIAVRVDELGVDLLSVAGHKLYAPKGVGALYIKRGLRLEKLIHGADHEQNRRAGTENVLEIVGLGKACQLAQESVDQEQVRLKKLRDRLETLLLTAFPEAKRNGHPQKRLPNTLSLSFPGVEANLIVSQLSESVALSAGAACHSDEVTLSHVLQAMHVPESIAMGTVRLSVGRFTTEEEIERAAKQIIDVIEKLKPGQDLPASDAELSEIKLTHFTHGLGCACKLRPQLLEEVLQKLPTPVDSRLLVGTETADDAAVYRLRDDLALVQTVDFFTPIVDDPFDFGRIAAANALSDIYAMGAEPIFALNIVAFPANRLPLSALEKMLAGAQLTAQKAGISIVGGHTVDDTEPKFGLAVSGVVHPEKIWKNIGARAGDVLVLTKPIGTGVLSTALKRGLLNKDQQIHLVETMARLNREAADALRDFEVHACTDVTGFGLIGHLLEMLKGSEVGAQLYLDCVPLLPETRHFIQMGIVPGGTRDNLQFTAPFVDYGNLSDNERLLLNDAQTSGGLLVS